MADIDHVAVALRSAQEDFEPIEPIHALIEAGGIESAYAVQAANIEYWCTRGRRVVGRKIGLTSRAVQEQLGVDQPDFGAILDDMVLDDGQSIEPRAVLQPRIEAEVAMVLGTGLEGDVSEAQVRDAVEFLMPALEVVGSRIRDWRISILDTIADNASCGRVVLGSSRVDPADVDLTTASMSMRIAGEVRSHGSGRECLGSPYIAVAWLARALASYGTPLRAGDLILSGALGPMVALEPLVDVEATIDGLGTVRTRLEAQT